MRGREVTAIRRGFAMTYDNRQFYIDGAWVDPIEPKELKVINPATEEVAGVISMGSSKDVDRAVMAARRAFESYSHSTPAERLALLERMLAAYKAHYDEIAQAISIEMGAPITLVEDLADRHRRRPHQRHDRCAEKLQVRGNARHRAPGPGAGRRLRLDHTVELAHESSGRQGRAGARGRMHHGAQALRVFAVQRHHLGQGNARGGRSGRRIQSHQRRWQRRRRAALLAS